MSNVFWMDTVDVQRVVGGKLTTVNTYPCHVWLQTQPNPNIAQVDIQPVLQHARIATVVTADIRNADFLVVQQRSRDGTVIKTYRGRCTEPFLFKSPVTADLDRLETRFTIAGSEPLDPVPPEPPQNPADITILYLSGGADIHPPNVLQAEIGKPFALQPERIQGYNHTETTVDGESVSEARIEEVHEDGHTIIFMYEVIEVPTYFRMLLNRPFTANDGSARRAAWHLYKRIPLEVVADDGFGGMTLWSEIDRVIHEETGETFRIKPREVLRLFESMQWVVVTSNPIETYNGFEFDVEPYVPTEEEAAAYVTNAYDNL